MMSTFFSDNNTELLAKIHKVNCILDDVENFTDKDVIMEYVLERKNNRDFNIVRGPQDKKCGTLVCRICGTDRLIVGQAAFYTAVKCANCQYEVGIHEG